jgi:CheY-like chemotaxis protein
MKKVLIADDEYIIADMFKEVIEDLGHKVVAVAHSGKEAVKQAIKLKPDVIFLDINMEYKTAGIDAYKSIKNKLPNIKVYFLTAYTKDVFENELPDIGNDEYIDKLKFNAVVENLLK